MYAQMEKCEDCSQLFKPVDSFILCRSCERKRLEQERIEQEAKKELEEMLKEKP